MEVPIRCECGRLRAVVHGVTPGSSNHGLCYCDDCQAFAHYLEKPERILDPHGGSDIYQLSPARLEWVSGRDQLACVRLTEKGILRWYAACCRSPIGNTMSTPALPFVGLILPYEPRGEQRRPDETAIGPVRSHVYAKFAKTVPGQEPPRNRGMAKAVARMARIMIAARLRGDHHRSAFFDPATRTPIATPRVLTTAERDALREAVGC